MLDPSPFLSTRRLGRRFVFVSETSSTNNIAADAPEWSVVAADAQTAGRGRLGHSWQSPPGENLYFTAVFGCGGIEAAEAATLPLAAGLAVALALQSIAAGRGAPSGGFGMKWPNDILSGGKKICGILCERRGERILAGVGVNVNQRSFPPDISARASSLLGCCGGPEFDRSRCLAAVLDSMENVYDRWKDGGFAAVYPQIAAIDLLKGKTVSIVQTDADPEPFRGVCRGIAPDGSLDVAGRRFYAGEAHVSGIGAD